MLDRGFKFAQIVVGPPDVPHGYTNNGTALLRLVAIHGAPRFNAEWLEPSGNALPFSVRLKPGRYEVEWFSVSTHATRKGATLTVIGEQPAELTSRFGQGAAVAYRGPYVGQGSIHVDGEGDACPGTGLRVWTIEADELTFETQSGACPGRAAVLRDAVYRWQ